ncbi:AMP-binding protein [Kiloniella laminariae]|uniref:AMP-binding protein n=1 Tax=Kiloniella laminariae TaxID=454162 RepID=A0ABT4LIL6_9PROT|nr:AMP-binding protein [Kiloniella laminariae]MCZ4280933.1 AMP-binding protein [Kiloniella laminariae]
MDDTSIFPENNDMSIYIGCTNEAPEEKIFPNDLGLRINLGLLLERQAARFPDNNFIIQAETGETLTYDEFNKRVNRLSHGLKDHGICPGDYVGIMLSNSIDFLVSSYALKKIGAIEVSINSTFRGISLIRMINLTGLETLITSVDYLDVIAEIATELPRLERFILTNDARDTARAAKAFPTRIMLPLSSILSNCTRDCAINTPDDETAGILFTSGTTGVSKGCAIPHRSSVRAAESMLEAFDLGESDCVYSPYPLFHCGAAQYDVLPAMMVGARAVIRQGFSVRNFWPEVCKYGATWFMALGSVQQLLWAAAECPEETQHRLRFIWGTPLPVNHDAFEARFKVRLVRGGGYGSTDAGSVALPLFHKTGAGKVLDRYEVAIVDERDNPLPTGAVGELIIRPKEPAIMASCYIGMPEETLKTWRNLWFHTGDLARLDEEGDLYWVARISERIRVKGEMVSAYEIEEVILSHPAVEDCAVLGAPDGTGEETVHPFITLRENAALNLEELKDFCTPRMSRFMVPTSMTLLDIMPRTPSGKPAKAELSKRFSSPCGS